MFQNILPVSFISTSNTQWVHIFAASAIHTHHEGRMDKYLVKYDILIHKINFLSPEHVDIHTISICAFM